MEERINGNGHGLLPERLKEVEDSALVARKMFFKQAGALGKEIVESGRTMVHEVESKLSLSDHIRKNPLGWMGGAFALGVLIETTKPHQAIKRAQKHSAVFSTLFESVVMTAANELGSQFREILQRSIRNVRRRPF